MGYERYPRGTNPQGDYYNRSDPQDYGQDYGSGREGSYSSARDYAAAGRLDNDDDRYGRREYGNQRYGQREQFGRDQGQGGSYGSGQGFYGQPGRDDWRQDRGNHGSYSSDGRRFEDVGRNRHADDDYYRGRQQGRDYGRQPQNRDYGRQPQGYDYEDRGFVARAGDEVRSWFGDEEAERRREMDSRYDDRGDRQGGARGGGHEDYHSWRSGQIAALDRDYDEYRRENRSRFENEFSTWRTNRQGQRESLNKVEEHQEVVGSDGAHVGTVDKVRGDRILLTKNDVDAGGQHHSIPCSWIQSVDDKVTLNKSADDAKKAWRDEERNQAMFSYGDNAKRDNAKRSGKTDDDAGQDFKSEGNLNKSFSGTY